MPNQLGFPSMDPNQLQQKLAEGQANPVQVEPPVEQAPPEDPRLTAALEEQARQRKNADMLRMFQGLIQASASGSGFKAENGMVDALTKRADEPITQYKEKVAAEAAKRKEGREIETHKADMDAKSIALDEAKNKLIQSNITTEDAKLGNDPNSKISQVSRAMAVDYLKRTGQPVDMNMLNGMTGSQIIQQYPDLQKVGMEYLKENHAVSMQESAQKATAKEGALNRANQKSMNDADNKAAMERELLKDKQDKAKEDNSLKKEDKKEQIQIKKENRKVRAEMDKLEQSTIEQIKKIQDVEKKFNNYSKSSIGGTGPIATLGGTTKYLSQDTEGLDSAFKNLSFDELTTKFKGMSKAIDSDRENAAFQSTQPSTSLDDKTNSELIATRKKAAIDLLAKLRAAKAKYDREGRFRDDEQADTGTTPDAQPQTVTQNGHTYTLNPQTGKYE